MSEKKLQSTAFNDHPVALCVRHRSIIPTERRVQQCTIEDANSKLLDVVTIANGDAVGREFETVFR